MYHFSRASILLFLVCIYLAGYAQPAADSSPVSNQVTAILGAMDSEVSLLKSELQHPQDTLVQGILFTKGTLQGQQVVITRSGVGKVNAAIITTLMLEHFKPARLLFSGIAGGLSPFLQPGDVVVATAVSYHDYGRKFPDSMVVWATQNPFGTAPNPVNFPCDSALLMLAKKATATAGLQSIAAHKPTVSFGLILTGDIFLSDGKLGVQLRNRTGADAIEMEGAAVAQVCYQQQVPFLIIRSLSDNANHTAAMDFKLYGKTAAENSAAIITAILKLLSE